MKNRKQILRYSSNLKSEYERYFNHNGEFNGLFIKFYESGQKHWKGQTFSNKWIGIWKNLYRDGKIYWIGTYKNDIKNGIKIEFKNALWKRK